MADKTNYRADRIDRLLNELKYEMTRGMMENEIEEQWGLTFVVPISRHFRNGVVLCEFRSHPVPRYQIPMDAGADLKIVRTDSKGS
jgi:hypothetical protein